jgi:hypothetical protein
MRVVFAGQVYGNCTFAPFLKAIAGLPGTLANQMEFTLLRRRVACRAERIEQMAALGCSPTTARCRKTTRCAGDADADLPLSLIHTDRVRQIRRHRPWSTKIYDYFLSGNPILNIGPVNADVNRLAAEIGAGFHACQPTIRRIAHVLEDAVNRRPTHRDPLSVQLPLFEAVFRVLDELRAV